MAATTDAFVLTADRAGRFRGRQDLTLKRADAGSLRRHAELVIVSGLGVWELLGSPAVQDAGERHVAVERPDDKGLRIVETRCRLTAW